MIKLSRPDIGNDELEEIRKVLDSKYLVQGEKVQEFENMVSDYLNVKHCIAVSSGTAALHLALIALNVKSGDEVIVPDFTFPATSNVVELVGAKSKFVDISLNSFCIDETKIEENITKKTKVIMPVQEFGQSSNMDKIMELAKKYKLKVIEDAACALGSEYKGRKVGTIGNLGCFSFHPRKAITTAEGGMVVTNDDELYEKIKILRNHGISYLNGNVSFTAAGFNYRMTDIQGALGIVQMKKLKDIIDYRILLTKEYDRLLKKQINLKIPVKQSYGRHVYQTYHVLLNNKINRDLLKEKLKDKGIETNIGAYAVHYQDYYKQKYAYNDNLFKNALAAYNQGLALPLHCELDIKDISFVCDAIKCILQ
ncbi:DegT/DnrJ/EryC1/StrS family aminotransferase [Clostridium sp. P21]|uniref:DegT/DnrJ/EryC1/StrS family aminotransferase n=1 Tax=Clostridium muellerianum TaxID=2716538 RepID=A0A7Y0EEG2_9CLOT|nr:DegT/DnrJ/EryC1/StrS family aminotransferase [Clostridium muellerianum]